LDDKRLPAVAASYQAKVAPGAPAAVNVVLLPLQTYRKPPTVGGAGAWAKPLAAIKLHITNKKLAGRLRVKLFIKGDMFV
jgi:hypothetical protein